MNSKTYTFQILTPMFLSGANREIAELREASIKGLLRYWWRTLNGNLSATDLYEKEIEIFGGAGDNAKKSPIRIRILNEQNVGKKLELQEKEKQLPQDDSYKVYIKTIYKNNKPKNITINILEYLAYGYNYKEEKTNQKKYRRYFNATEEKANQIFQVQFMISNQLKQEQQKEIEKALQVFSFFGGLGSRSRNGFGSFQIKEFNLNKEEIKNLFTELKKTRNNLPEFPAFSSYSRLWITKQGFDSWDKALAELGKIYKEVRGEIKKQFQEERRQYIAQPFKKNIFPKFSRYAKPYYLSIHKQDKKYFGTILHLPHQYAKGLDKDKDKDKNNNTINHQENANEVWNKVNEYFQKQQILEEIK